MPIDWFTVTAQILNFIVLVWILKRFLYRPVLKAMDERQKRVEESMLAAAREKEESAKERAHFESKRQDLERQRESILAKSVDEAKTERTQLIEAARAEYRSLQQRWRDTLRKEQEQLGNEIAHRVQSEALAVARKMLHDLADMDIQERIARKFIQKLEEMPPQERESFLPPQNGSEESRNSEAVLLSAFELSEGLRADIEQAARLIIGRLTPLRFEICPSLGAGMELAVNGHKASWTMDNYLSSLDARFRELLNSEKGSNDLENE